MKNICVYLRLSAVLVFLALSVFAQNSWQARLDGKVNFYQTTDFGLLVAGTEKSLYAIDDVSGEIVWRRGNGKLDETSITPVPGTDLILLSLEKNGKSRLSAVDLLTGDEIWTSDKIKGDVMQLAVEPNLNILCAVLVKNPRGNVGEELKREPIVGTFDLSSGELLWKRDLGGEVEMMPAAFENNSGKTVFTLDNYRPPLILDGRVFLFYEGATSFEVRTGKEREREKFKVNEDGLALTEADAVFDDNFIYTSGRGKIRAVSRRDGKIEWEANDLGVTPEMFLGNGILYVRTGGQFTRLKDGEIVNKGSFGVSAIETKKGKTLWRFKGADKGLTNFVFADENTILIADRDELIGIDTRNGKKKFEIEHKVEKAQFVLINEVGNAVVGGRETLAAFQIQDSKNSRFQDFKNSRFQDSKTSGFQDSKTSGFQNLNIEGFAFQTFKADAKGFSAIPNPKSQIPNPIEVWRVKYPAPSRGILRFVGSIALRATALYFRYGGLVQSGVGLAFGASRNFQLIRSVSSLRWSGLKTRFSSVDLTSLATNYTRNYVSSQIKTFGIASRASSVLNADGTIRRANLPNGANILRRTVPSKGDVQERLLDRIDPVRQIERLSGWLIQRKRLAEVRGNFMYFYTETSRGKGLVGVNIHTGQTEREIQLNNPDPRFVTDELTTTLFSADGNRILAFDLLENN